MWVRSDVTSGRNRRWEWRPDAGDAEDGKTTSDASGRGARASDAGLIFADAPSVRTAGDTDTPINNAPPPTPPAPFVRFTILARLSDARIQPAPGAPTISQSHPVVRPCPPIAVTAVVTTLPRSASVRLDLHHLSPPEPARQPPPHPVKTPWIWRSMAVQHPLLPRPGRVPLRWT